MIDSVDDLHEAESLAVQVDPDYCRPSCIENAEHWDGCADEAECGCPCHHRSEVDKTPECPACGQTGYRPTGRSEGIESSDGHSNHQ